MKIKSCVGCGYCCLKTPCEAARRLYPGVTECPQLEWDESEGRYFCGLMRLPGLIGEGYRKELYAGAGCCSNLNSWRNDVKKRSRAATNYSYPQIPTMFQAFLKAYGAEPFRSSDSTALLIRGFRNELENLNYSNEDVKYIIKNVVYYIQENKTSKFKGFMG